MNGLSKKSVNWLEVDEEAVGQRIDNFLLRLCKGVPKSHIYRILRSGEVRVNRGRVSAEYRLQLGDQLRLPPIRLAARATAGPHGQTAADTDADAAVAASYTPHIPPREFQIVHEDEALLVVDKPAGLAVHGGSGVSFGLIEQLRRMRPQAKLLELAHRLDRETSGLLIVAKKRTALTRLHDAFRRGSINKRYLALVKGQWFAPRQDVRLPLLKYLTAEDERRVRVANEGKAAHSIVRLVARWQNFSLLEVELKTGRTHQIRVHLAHLGFPLAGDDKYGDFADNKALQKQGLKRMFLHAASLRLRHPTQDESPLLSLQAPLPADLQSFLHRLDAREHREHGSYAAHEQNERGEQNGQDGQHGSAV